jgi:signal transduction histidine kinase
VSTYTTHAATEVAGGPLVETGRRVVPGAPKLAVFAAVVVLVVVSMEASFPSHAAWLVGLGVLSIAVGLARLTPGTARRAGIETERATRDAAGLALENARLEAELQVTSDELRRSRARIAIAAAAERHRLERELHDRAQNRLVALRIRLGLAQEQAEESTPDLARLLAELGDQADAVGEELRRIASGIYPASLDMHGLAQALMAEARFSSVAVRILDGQVGFSTPGVELAVYLCCLEAIQNAAKHAGRDVRVTVRLCRGGDELTFSIEDDGCGFDPAAAEGSGLPGMRDRIASFDGRLEISSTCGHGTTVAGAVPWPPRTTYDAPSAPWPAAVSHG